MRIQDFSDPQKMVVGLQISVVVTGLKFLKFPSATNLNKLMFYHLIIITVKTQLLFNVL